MRYAARLPDRRDDTDETERPQATLVTDPTSGVATAPLSDAAPRASHGTRRDVPQAQPVPSADLHTG